MTSPLRFVLVTLLAVAAGGLRAASLHTSAIFSDGMVLQRNQPAAIWGTAAPNAKVSVSVANKTAEATANADGDWKVLLPPLATATDQTLTIRAGGEALTLRNVAIGDVYFAGGQSNMQYALRELPNGKEIIAAAHNPNIRIFSAGHAVSFRPQKDFIPPLGQDKYGNRWLDARPENAEEFPSVAYFFAEKIQHDENVPVGIIQASWGGTPIQAHMSLEANRELPFHRARALEIQAKPSSEEYSFDPTKATPTEPASIFNAMINPMIPYTIVGCLWYQGEHNWNYPYRYGEQFVTFINDLRIRWGLGYVPFYAVQLPNIGKVPVEPGDDMWSILRESQAAALNLPNTRLLVSLDLGDGDIHPKNKKAFGERLARMVRKDIYHHDGVVEGPRFTSLETKDHLLVLSFESNGSGLAVRGDALKGFAVAGEDKVWKWADARIDGDKVIVSAANVDHPVAVRYGWGENPTATLMNKEGLPAYPFRSDAWPVPADGFWGPGGY